MRYGALRLISGVYRVLGFLALIGTGLAAAGLLIAGFAGNRYGFGYGSSPVVVAILAAVGTLISGGIIAISLIAVSEMINGFVEIVENTHAQRNLTEQMLQRIGGTRSAAPKQPASKPEITDPFA